MIVIKRTLIFHAGVTSLSSGQAYKNTGLHMFDSQKNAPFIALLAAAVFGVSTPLAKFLLGDMSPWVLASLLYLGSGCGLALILLFRRKDGTTEARLRRADLPWLLGTIVFGGIAGPILLLLGLTLTDAASASLLLNLEAVFTLLLAWIVFKEHVDVRLLIGAAAIVAGAIILSWQGRVGDANLGIGLIALACLSWGIDNNVTRKISAVDPFVLASIKGIVAGSVNAVLAYGMGGTLPAAVPLAGALMLGFVSYGLGLVLFILALRYLGTARAGAYYGTAPFIGAMAATVLLGDTLTPTLVIAGALMALGAWLHLSERHGHEHIHDSFAHDHRHVHDEHHQHEHGPLDPADEPHAHAHQHTPLKHAHAHWPDIHHRHRHGQ
jgi:drug/metabolite transporter (DMT)-like permease